jgi:hypothetical protein
MGARRGLGMDKKESLAFLAGEGFLHLFWLDGRAPFQTDFKDLPPEPGNLIGNSPSENAVPDDSYPVARFHEVRDERFHPGASCAGDRNGHAILRLEDGPEHFLRLIHHAKKVGIEVTNGPCGQCV